jgi:mobilome CxxCx(11)CxxC protein
MPLTDNEIRQAAWNKAVHAEGTYSAFSARSKRFRRLTGFRDFLGLALPVCVVFLLTTTWVQNFSTYRDWALGALGVVAGLQALMTIWSLIARWDEGLAYSIRAIRDSYEMKQAWERIGKNDAQDLPAEYSLRDAQQTIIDSHDIQREITMREKQAGMRAGLFEYQRPCISCKKIPGSPKRPLFVWKRCGVCGGTG